MLTPHSTCVSHTKDMGWEMCTDVPTPCGTVALLHTVVALLLCTVIVALLHCCIVAYAKLNMHANVLHWLSHCAMYISGHHKSCYKSTDRMVSSSGLLSYLTTKSTDLTATKCKQHHTSTNHMYFM